MRSLPNNIIHCSVWPCVPRSNWWKYCYVLKSEWSTLWQDLKCWPGPRPGPEIWRDRDRDQSTVPGWGPGPLPVPKFKRDRDRDQSSGPEMTGTGTNHRDQKWKGPGSGLVPVPRRSLAWSDNGEYKYFTLIVFYERLISAQKRIFKSL